MGRAGAGAAAGVVVLASAYRGVYWTGVVVGRDRPGIGAGAEGAEGVEGAVVGFEGVIFVTGAEDFVG